MQHKQKNQSSYSDCDGRLHATQNDGVIRSLKNVMVPKLPKKYLIKERWKHQIQQTDVPAYALFIFPSCKNISPCIPMSNPVNNSGVEASCARISSFEIGPSFESQSG